MEDLPFGYTHRQKRSHAQMQERDRSASPAWRNNTHHNNNAPQRPFHSSFPLFQNYDPTPHYDDYHEQPLRPAAPSDELNYEPSDSLAYPPTERPSSASAIQPRSVGPPLPHNQQMASSTPTRFAGDGFDYRRPVSSARAQDTEPVDLTSEEEDMAIDLSRDEDVIDLTADDSGYGASQDGHNFAAGRHRREQRGSDHNRRDNNRGPRLPRGMDIIIDLDNGEEEWAFDTPAPEAGSPEIEFISSRPVNPRRLPTPTYGFNRPDEPDVEFLRENALSELEAHRRSRGRDLDHLMATMNGRFGRLREQVERFHVTVRHSPGRFNQEPIAPRRGASRGLPQIHAFVAPVMDFDAIGFDIGPRVRVPEPPPATYEAPEKAPEGFTRGPEETDVLVCPNCGDELCVGDDEIKRQVWIVKACGHVYCGECTANRSVKKSSKGKERPVNTNPFKDCVVEGCGKHVAHRKTMIQVFL